MIKLNVPRISQRYTKSSGSCGPTVIQQIMAFNKDNKSLEEILGSLKTYDKVGVSSEGQLGSYLIDQGYNVKMYSQDTEVFDPSWFGLNNEGLVKKLESSSGHKKAYDKYVANGFISYLRKNGKIVFEPVTKGLVTKFLERKTPIAAGVNDCLLYGFKRSNKSFYDDDIKGESGEHEIVIAGYKKDKFLIVDPSDKNPFSNEGKYWYNADKLIANVNSMGGNIIIAKK